MLKLNMNKRLLSIDVLRGMTLIFMIIVNTPGSWNHVYAPLLHADWNGLTPTDYIFPNFLFIVGVSIVLSLNNIKSDLSKNQVMKKIIWRSFKIYLVGLFLWVFLYLVVIRSLIRRILSPGLLLYGPDTGNHGINRWILWGYKCN